MTSETISGQIEHVTFHNPETGFAVLKVKVRGMSELVPVLGTLTSVTPGEQVEAVGRWETNAQHGRQFKAQELKTAHPASLEGIQRYLASGAVRGVGPKLASKIVEIYKEQSLEILGQYPDMLLCIRGIGKEKLKRISASWKEQRNVREIMLFLHSHGIGSARATKIHRLYGDAAVRIIKDNPYQLAVDVRGIGFQTADQLAKRLGMDPNSPHRARAGLLHALEQLAGDGHCGCPEPELIEATVKLLDGEREIIEDAAEDQVKAKAIIREKRDGDSWLFPARLHAAEVGFAASVKRLIEGEEHPFPDADVEQAITDAERTVGLQLAEAQKEAIRQACRGKLLTVTGGPGVGKTTLVRSLLEIFETHELRTVLTAPTGRAAKRLAETTGRAAKTVHRLLEFDPAGGGFKRDRGRPLSGDLFVLDETSMVDVVLANHFLEAVPDGAVVVFVGDPDQLPSVGPGSVLADLIHSRVAPTVRLTEIFRQAQESRIVAAAHAVNEGRTPDPEPPGKELTDFYFTPCQDPEAIGRMIVRLVAERIPARFGLDPTKDVQTLTPMNRTSLGARNLNAALQERLNPSKGQPEIQRFGWTFRVGDRVLQTENNYDRGVFNGDLGVIRKIDPVEQELTVSLDDQLATYDFNSLDELALAYALTIHKSQGSEYPCVVIPLHTQHFIMLQRNLLYTGITRGKRLVVLVGSQQALETAVAREDSRRRMTALRDRLQQLF